MALSLQDVVRRYKDVHSTWEEFPNKVSFQMNDTHPTMLGECLAHGLHCYCIAGCGAACEGCFLGRASPWALSCLCA